ncbi:MAG: transglycosylase domain-containing protein, partial [Patescibacteria group bacterium]
LTKKKPASADSKGKSTSTHGEGAGKKPKRKSAQRSRRQKILRGIGLAVLGGCIAAVLGVAGIFAYYAKDLPNPEKITDRHVSESTKVYARDGVTVLYEVGEVKRTTVALDQIDDQIKWATIALEDHNFYHHRGVELKAIFRSLGVNFLSGGSQGGSTITQQFVRNVALKNDEGDFDRSLTRKIKEAILALEVERKYSKDQILAGYLNEVWYGGNYYGVESASQGYFGISAKDVSLAQAATLASLPKGGSIMTDPDRLKERRDYALDQMADLGYVTEEEAVAAKAEEVNMRQRVDAITAAHFVFYVTDELIKKYGETTVLGGGLKVTTTLDLDKQGLAEQAVAGGMDKVRANGGSNAGLVAIDTHTGQILAMVGSYDFFADDTGQVNVTTRLNSPGSSIKPLVYYNAFKKGYIPETKVFDVETDFPTETGIYHPRNFSLDQNGPITLRSALNRSLNIPAVKMAYLTGIDMLLETADALGYTTLTDRDNYGLSLAIGGGDVTLLDHTSAFATLAREGERHPVTGVLKVETSTGQVLYEWKDAPQQALDQKAARILNSVLSDQAARGYTFAPLNLKDRPVAAKTGTSQEFRDAWTMGYTPSLAAGVWVGNNDNTKMNQNAGADGVSLAAPIWNTFMTRALDGTSAETFQKAEYTASNPGVLGNLEKRETKKIDKVTKKLIPDECVAAYPPEYMEDKEFKVAHDLLFWVDKSNPNGGVPEHPEQDPMFTAWETGVTKWAEEKPDEYLTEKTPREQCDLRDPRKAPTVTITSPESGETLVGNDWRLRGQVIPGSGRTIVKLDFYVDAIRVDSQSLSITSTTNVVANYVPTTLTAGAHAFKLVATDSLGTSTESAVSFTYQKSGSKNDSNTNRGEE